MKKILSLLLVVVFLSTCLSIAFANGEDEIVKHEVTFEVPAYSTITPGDDNTDIWGSMNLIAYGGDDFYTPYFVIPDRYFAFEMKATGNSINTFTVSLFDSYGSFYASGTNYADGSKLKVDWITVDAGESYRFRIYNGTSSTLNITITYYSWV